MLLTRAIVGIYGEFCRETTSQAEEALEHQQASELKKFREKSHQM